MLLQTHVGPDLHRRNCGGQVSHAHQIVGGAGEGKNPVHFADSAMPNLPHQRNRLQPAEAFFDPLSLPLADPRIPRAAWCGHRSRCRRAARGFAPHAASLADSGTRHKSARVESFVAAHRHRLRARKLLHHDQRRIALRRPVRLEHFRVHDQSVAVLHQQIPAVTQLRLLARLCAPAAPRDRSSIRGSRSTAARRESSPWDCPDHPAAASFLSLG